MYRIHEKESNKSYILFLMYEFLLSRKLTTAYYIYIYYIYIVLLNIVGHELT